MHAKSVEMRRSILAEQVELAERLVDLGKVQRFYDSVVGESAALLRFSSGIGQGRVAGGGK